MRMSGIRARTDDVSDDGLDAFADPVANENPACFERQRATRFPLQLFDTAVCNPRYAARRWQASQEG